MIRVDRLISARYEGGPSILLRGALWPPSPGLSSLTVVAHVSSRRRDSNWIFRKLKISSMLPIAEPDRERFAKTVAGYLEQGRLHRRYQRLRLAVEPKFLGMVREHLSEQTRQLISEEINEDLSTLIVSVGHRFESSTARPVEDGMHAGSTTIAALAAVVLSGLVYVNCPQIRSLCAEGMALGLVSALGLRSRSLVRRKVPTQDRPSRAAC
jgi:protein required for attachment to host cells